MPTETLSPGYHFCSTAVLKRLRFHSRDGSRPPRSPSMSRSEEHTSELQSLRHLVCRLLLEKKKKKKKNLHGNKKNKKSTQLTQTDSTTKQQSERSYIRRYTVQANNNLIEQCCTDVQMKLRK